MAKLSKTDTENLNRLVEAHGALDGDFYKGSYLYIKKLMALGLIRQTVFQGRYWYEITAEGRKAVMPA
jgi:hypothetical protein